jgi:ribosomal-protein-alanine N-acetyltransferase
MIETKRCRLIRIQESDYEDVKKLYVNHLVRMYLGGTTDDEFLLREKFTDVLKRSNNGSLIWLLDH